MAEARPSALGADEGTALVKHTEYVQLSDTHVRHGFVRKVYGILGVQLCLTTLIGAFVMHFGYPLLKTSPTTVLVFMYLCLAMSLLIMCTWICFPGLMRSFPTNYILLALFTVTEAVMVGFICIGYTQSSVLICLGITAGVVLALTLFACQTSFDFTGFGPYLFCFMMVLFGFGLVVCVASLCGAHGPAWSIVRMVYAACGALLFSMFIIFDTQLIIGGRHSRHQFEIDDYCIAAISLYIDIIQLFLYLLQLFGDRR